MSTVEDVEVEVVEAVALGDRAGELVLGERAALEQEALGRAAGRRAPSATASSTPSRVT